MSRTDFPNISRRTVLANGRRRGRQPRRVACPFGTGRGQRSAAHEGDSVLGREDPRRRRRHQQLQPERRGGKERAPGRAQAHGGARFLGVDTAPLYGQSEAVLGELIAGLGNRPKYFLATKTLPNVGPDQAQSVFEESLRRLKVPSVELIQVHNLAHADALMPVLAEWKKAGKVKYIGVTTSVPSAHPQMIDALNKHKMDFIQVDYSLGNRASADKVLPLAQSKGVAVLINVPFGGRRSSVFSRAGRPQAAGLGGGDRRRELGPVLPQVRDLASAARASSRA